jgi:WD40 repeat protein
MAATRIDEGKAARHAWAMAHAASLGADPGPPARKSLPSVQLAPRNLTGHNARVWSADTVILPDGRILLVTGGSDATARIWDAATGDLLHVLHHHGMVRSVAFGAAADGRVFVATGSRDNTASIWDPLTGRRVNWLTGHTDDVHGVAFGRGRDDRLLVATCGGDGRVLLWAPESGDLVHQLAAGGPAMSAVALASDPDGRLLAAAGARDGTSALWDAETGGLLVRNHRHRDIETVTLAPGHDGGLLLGLGGTGYVDVSRITDGKRLADLRTENRTWSIALHRTPGNRVVLAAGHGRQAQVWELTGSPRSLAVLGHQSDVNAVCLTALTGDLCLITACDDGIVRIHGAPWTPPETAGARVPDGGPTPRPPGRLYARPVAVPGGPLSHRPAAVSLVPARDGLFVLAAITDLGTRQAWGIDDTTAAELPGWPMAPLGGITTAAVTTDERGDLCHLSHSADEFIYYTGTGTHWRFAGAEDSSRLLTVPPGQSRAAILTKRRSGELLAAISTPLGIEMREPATGHAVVLLGNGGQGSRILTLHAEREHVFAVAGEGVLSIWDNDQQRPVKTMNLPATAGTRAVALTTAGNGRFLVAVDEKSAASLWDADAGTRIRSLAAHASPVRALAFGRHPDGTLVVASAADDEVHLHDAANGDLLTTVRVRIAGPAALALRAGPDEQLYLAVGSDDRQVLLYTLTSDVDTGDGRWAFQLRPGVERVFTSGQVHKVVALGTGDSVKIAASKDDMIVLHDTGHSDKPLRMITVDDIWDLAVGAAADGRSLLAAVLSGQTDVVVYDTASGEQVAVLPASFGYTDAVAMTNLADGTLVAAAAGVGGTRLWNVEAGELLGQNDGFARPISAVRLGQARDGHLVVATATADRSAQLWFADADRPAVTLTISGGLILDIALTRLPDGTAIAATSGSDRLVRIWDVDSGALIRTVDAHVGVIAAMSFVTLPDGSPLLISVGVSRVQLIDPVTGDVRASFPLDTGLPYSRFVFAAALEDKRTLMIASRQENDVELRRIDLTPPDRYTRPELKARPVSRAAVLGLAGLAQHGLHPPLGLLADMMSLIGGAPSRNGLDTLRGNPGFIRLVELRWPPEARAGLAALLLEDVTFDKRFVAPYDTSRRLISTLTGILGRYTGPYHPVPADLPALTAAADRISEPLVTLLSVLGSVAVAADPGLPLRVRNQADTMPFLPPRLLELLSTQQPILDLRPSPGITERTTSANETTGISRRGLLTNLLGTQLALPDELFRIQVELDELLYRTRRTQRPPTVLPATLILDTTPPTFGPAETVLRLVAHSLTTAAWTSATDLALVTFDRPGVALPLTMPADLVAIWTGRTLRPADLTAALEAAVQLGRPRTILLTQHHLLADSGIRPTSSLRVLTTHMPGTPPRGLPASPDHVHLPPDPAPAAILRAVLTLLRP